ncbi:hypothetical protein [Helicobacter sp. 11S02596-1]|uniref:hypothetical protein n=1 Tax=Helicobacter sp. 11S02596-1 TaxID=1476194 RepID=UPI000BA60B3F|nr:hypothetical protein [Helicobacter sp. 11S02596-1]PAF41381.1 hypothetical protein BJI48_08805 [Helicobacter sp. 11S02596-1]
MILDDIKEDLNDVINDIKGDCDEFLQNVKQAENSDEMIDVIIRFKDGVLERFISDINEIETNTYNIQDTRGNY